MIVFEEFIEFYSIYEIVDKNVCVWKVLIVYIFLPLSITGPNSRRTSDINIDKLAENLTFGASMSSSSSNDSGIVGVGIVVGAPGDVVQPNNYPSLGKFAVYC